MPTVDIHRGQSLIIVCMAALTVVIILQLGGIDSALNGFACMFVLVGVPQTVIFRFAEESGPRLLRFPNKSLPGQGVQPG